jgi:preprotein translocase subunit SecD
MRLTAPAATAILLGIVLGACGGNAVQEMATPPTAPADQSAGGGDSVPTTRMVLEADLSLLPAGMDVDTALNNARDAMTRRLEGFELSGFSITREGANRLIVTIPEVDPEEARQLLLGRTAQLEFRKPVLEEATDDIMCERADGSTYAVLYQPGLFILDKDNNSMPCPPEGEEAAGGTATWEPATGFDSQGEETVLTGALVRPNVRVGVDPSECGNMPPCILIEFTSEGSVLLEQITEELLGLPLAIFLDEQIIAAPMVNDVITGGDIVITGLDRDEARTLAIQLNVGALPAPFREVLVETTAP